MEATMRSMASSLLRGLPAYGISRSSGHMMISMAAAEPRGVLLDCVFICFLDRTFNRRSLLRSARAHGCFERADAREARASKQPRAACCPHKLNRHARPVRSIGG